MSLLEQARQRSKQTSVLDSTRTKLGISREKSIQDSLNRIKQAQEQEKKQSIQDTQGKYLQEYEDTQSKGLTGVLNKINSFFGRGVGTPELAKETPEYTQKRKSEQLKSFGNNLKNLFTENTSQTIYDTFLQSGIDEQTQQTIDTNTGFIKKLVELNKVEKDATKKAQRENSIQSIINGSAELAKEAGGEIAKKTTLQLIGQSVGTALELTPFLGFQSAGTQAVAKVGGKVLGKQLVKKAGGQLAKDVISEGALFGGATGVGEGMKQEGATLGSIAKSGAVGAVAGGALTGGIVGLGSLGGKLFSKLAEKKLVKNATIELEKSIGKLTPEESSIIKEGIAEGISKEELTKTIQESRKVDDMFGAEKVEEPKIESKIETPEASQKPKIEAGEALPAKKIETVVPKKNPLIQEARKYAEAGDNKYFYVRNVENKGGYIKGKPSAEGTGRFNQKYEPTGEYMNIVSKRGYDSALPNLKKGTTEFKNPLVIETDSSPNWKKELSDKYGGLTRDELSQAIKKDGYDGIITMNRSGAGKLYPSEVVDIKSIKSQPLQEGVEKVAKEVPKAKPKVGVPEKTKSNFAKRLNEELPDNLKIDEDYNVANIKGEVDKAEQLINKDTKKAIQIAMGKESADANTQTATSIVLAEKAKQQGDWETVAQLYNTRRIANTRRGQEIAMEKASIKMNPEEQYMKEVVTARMNGVKLGSQDIAEALKRKSKTERVFERVKKQTGEVKKALDREIKLSKAQAVFNDLICK